MSHSLSAAESYSLDSSRARCSAPEGLGLVDFASALPPAPPPEEGKLMMALISDSAAVGALFEAKRMKLFMTQLPPSHGTATARLVAARESELQLPANEQQAARVAAAAAHARGV